VYLLHLVSDARDTLEEGRHYICCLRLLSKSSTFLTACKSVRLSASSPKLVNGFRYIEEAVGRF
jgi:hypothetical protein